MSLLWDLLQDHRYFKTRDQGDTLQARVTSLEKQSAELQDLLKQVLQKLEAHLNEDVNKDGFIGKPPSKRVVIRKKGER